MQLAAPRSGVRTSLAALALVAVGLVAVYATLPEDPRSRSLASNAAQLCAMLTATAVLLRAGRGADAWPGTRGFAVAALSLALLDAFFLAQDLAGVDPARLPGPGDLVFLVIAALIVVPFQQELREHFDEEDRLEVAADVALIGASAAILVYLLIRPGAAPEVGSAGVISSASFAVAAVAGVSAWGALALWVPSPMHLGIFGVLALMSGAAIPFAHEWVRGTYLPGEAGIELPFAFAPLALAALLTMEPAMVTRPAPRAGRGWGRPILMAGSVATACVALMATAALHRSGRVSVEEQVVMAGIVALALTARIVMNQVRGSHARQAAHEALAEKDLALREAASAIDRLQEAHEAVAASENRLRSLFEAAVDGMVELDPDGLVRRTNGAFAAMAGLQPSAILGRSWGDLAATVEGADLSLATLPATGQATLTRDGNATYLEARTSILPAPEGGRLLLIRDVTSAKVADQTIRNLFKFLQDRDDDRSRLLRRTNVAIEQERNRIARDLHDGPVQGVSAASLSLEAALLMLRTGSIDQGIETLTKVRLELAEECDNLRRLMGDLRPPVLEERGLIPALRELLDRFERDTGITTRFRGRALVEVPEDLETLAYRVVQEALSNAGKHSEARTVEVSVEAVAGQVRVEIADDGKGFESGRSRDFLRSGRVGLASMRERTELAKGTLMVRSTPGSGTTVVATLPLDPIRGPAQPAMA